MNILNAAKLAGIGGGAALVPLLAIWWFVPEKGAGTKTTTAVSASPDEGVVLGIMVAVALMALIGILFALWRYGTPTLFRRSEKKKPPPEGGFFKRQWGQHKSKLPAPIAFASLLILCNLFFPDQFGWYWKRQELFWGTIIGLTIATWIFGLGGWAKITALAIVAVILAGNARQLAVGEWWGTLDTTKEYVGPQQPPPSTSSMMRERGMVPSSREILLTAPPVGKISDRVTAPLGSCMEGEPINPNLQLVRDYRIFLDDIEYVGGPFQNFRVLTAVSSSSTPVELQITFRWPCERLAQR